VVGLAVGALVVVVVVGALVVGLAVGALVVVVVVGVFVVGLAVGALVVVVVVGAFVVGLAVGALVVVVVGLAVGALVVTVPEGNDEAATEPYTGRYPFSMLHMLTPFAIMNVPLLPKVLPQLFTAIQ